MKLPLIEPSLDYRIIQNNDVLAVQSWIKLEAPLSDVPESAKKFVHAEELCGKFYSTNLWDGHSERDRMTTKLNVILKKHNASK